MTNETHNNNPIKTTKARRWFRFRLRTLLIMVTLLSIPLGWVGWELDQRRRENEAITWVEGMGGDVYFYFPNDERSWWEKTKDEWFGARVQNVRFDTNVSDLSPLAELKNLKELDLNNFHVSDLSALAELKNVKELYLSGTQASDLSPLAELEDLTTLYLNSTQVCDLSLLTELTNLRVLYLAGTQASDLSPLVELKNLEWLGLTHTLVTNEQAQELRLALPTCATDLRYFDRLINDQRNTQH
jgi:hypothetical protein